MRNISLEMSENRILLSLGNRNFIKFSCHIPKVKRCQVSSEAFKNA